MKFDKVGYCIFWIPVRIPPFKNKKVDNKDKESCIIRDVGFFIDLSREQGLISIRIKEEHNNSFIIDVYKCENQLSSEQHKTLYRLEYIEHDIHGFAQYKIYFNNNVGFPHEAVWNSISYHIYRIFKKLFHKHRYHSENEYFITRPLPFSKNKIESKEKIKTYYRFYIEQIEEKLKEYRNFLNENIENKYSLTYRFSYFINIRKQTQLSYLTREIDKKIGVVKYLEVLVNQDNFKDKLHIYSEDIKHIRDDLSEVLNARRSVQSVMLGFSGFLIGIISFILSFYWSNQNKKSQANFEELILHSSKQDSAQFINLTKEIFKSHIYSKEEFDSLYKLVNKELCSSKDSLIYYLNNKKDSSRNSNSN